MTPRGPISPIFRIFPHFPSFRISPLSFRILQMTKLLFLQPLDVEFMKRLHDKVNIIPVIGKSDTLTPDEIAHFKKQIMNQIEQSKIR